jgi:hypothetical protein
MMRSKRVWAMAAAMIALSAAAAAAQGGYPGGYPGGRTGSGEGARPERPGGERRRIITASQLEGPPEPGFAAARFEFDSTEAAAYKQAYDSFMMATQPQRDSARALRLAVRNEMQAGDHDAARGNFPELQRLGDVLVKAEQQFDAGLKRVLTKNHFKDYQQWKQQQQHEEERRQPADRAGPGR